MSQQYLLPCTCGRQLLVESTQAGETLVCECGARRLVPTLREIRNLPLAQQAAPTPAAAARPQRRLGCLLAFGTTLLVVSLLTALVAYIVRANIDTTMDHDRFRELSSELIDNLRVDQTLEMWQDLLQGGMTYEGTPSFEVNRINRLRLLWVIRVSLATAAVGLLTSIVALVASWRTNRR